MASILCEYEEMSKLVQTCISSIQSTSYVKYVGSCAVRIAFSLVRFIRKHMESHSQSYSYDMRGQKSSDCDSTGVVVEVLQPLRLVLIS